MSANFVHLHLHTEYSIEDSVVRVKSLMETAAQCRMPAVAMTDQNNLFAMVKFYRAALEQGIKPIIGTEIWLRDSTDQHGLSRLILLCKDNAGYRNLSRLLTRAYLDGQENNVPVVNRAWLDSNTAGGLMALSGGRGGRLGRDLMGSRIDNARGFAEELREIFSGDFYIELQRTGRAQEEEYNHRAVELAALLRCPVVATNDVRFLHREDFEAHEARVCIHQGRVLTDDDRPRDYSDQQYFRDQEEMASLFADIPEALENSVEIAKS